MTADLQEDILEAILNLRKSVVSQSDIESFKERGVLNFEIAISSLLKENMIREEKGGYSLTPVGTRKAETIARKHAVLASFLTDVLGAKPEDASQEACILEHTISNDTINKLDSFLDKTITTPTDTHGEYVDHQKLTATNPIVPLIGCKEGSLLHVSMIKSFSKHNRLLDLGVIPGELITLRRKLPNDAVVIKVKGCDVALSPEIASNILVERCNSP